MNAKALVGIVAVLAVLVMLLVLVAKSNDYGNDALDEELEDTCKSGFFSAILGNSPECEEQDEQSTSPAD
jgi:hypothetical protein